MTYVITEIINSVGLLGLTNELQLVSKKEKKAATNRLLYGFTKNRSIPRVSDFFFFLVKFAPRFHERL